MKAIIGLGHNLGMSITADGVETVEQLTFLRGQGSDQLQGYLLGRPAADANFSEFQTVRLRSLLMDPRADSEQLIPRIAVPDSLGLPDAAVI